MGRPVNSPNGNKTVHVTVVKDARHVGRTTRVALWLVNVAIPKLMPDHLTAPLRQRARNADNRMERTARRLRRQISRVPKNRDEHSR